MATTLAIGEESSLSPSWDDYWDGFFDNDYTYDPKTFTALGESGPGGGVDLPPGYNPMFSTQESNSGVLAGIAVVGMAIALGG